MNPDGNSGSTGGTFGPRGQQVMMLNFKLKALNGDVPFNQISVQNAATQVYFGNGISKVTLYKDNGTGSFNGTQPQLASTSFSSSTLGAIPLGGFSDVIPSGNTFSYYLVYTIDDTATLTTSSTSDTATTTNIVINSINSNSTAPLLVAPVSHTLSLSGYKTIKGRAIAPSVVVPGQTKIPILALSIKAIGESVKRNIQIKLQNAAANFVSGNGNLKGVVRAYLVKDQILGNGIANDSSSIPYGAIDTVLSNNPPIIGDTQLSNGVFNSKSTVTFTLNSNELNLPAATSANMFLVYEIGTDFPVSSNTVIKAQLTSLQGTGEGSGQLVQTTQSVPAAPVESNVAGLVYTDLSKIIVNGNFGPGAVVPMLQFSLIAYRTNISLSRLDIKNPILDSNNPSQTAPFISDPTGLNGITKVSLYTDGGTPNGIFDGINSQDTLIGELELGKGDNTSDTAFIPISLNSQPLLITSYNADESNTLKDNRKRIYVVYQLGTGVSGSKTSAQLNDAKGFAYLDLATTKNIQLGGTKPGIPTPPATLDIKQTNVSIRSVTAVAPTLNRVVQGQLKVPMLAISLKVDNNFPSASFQIKNESDTYGHNNLGVKKVWLYQDAAPYGVLTSADQYISSNDQLTNTRLVNLSGVNLQTGSDQRFLVLYDIGRNATITPDPNQPNIRAQLQSISGQNNGSTLVLAGEIPVPRTPASTIVGARQASLSLTSTGFDTTLVASSTQNITLTVSNLMAQAVSVNAINLRFYYGGPNGPDVSYEFTTQIKDGLSSNFRIAANSSTSRTFLVRLRKPEFQGTVYVDGYVEYTPTAGGTAALTRYSSSSDQLTWNFAVSNPVTIPITSTIPIYSWSIPQYVQSMVATKGSSSIPFGTGNAIALGSNLTITFRDKGKTLNYNSIGVKLNNNDLSYVETDGVNSSFRYSPSAGTLTINNLGTSDGRLDVSVKDLEGIALSPLALTFIVSSDTARMENLLIYPSPYKPGTTLLMGFNLTMPSTVTFYVYNHLGLLVWKGEKHFASPGYQLLSSRSDSSLSLPIGTDISFITDLANVLSTGMYLCRAVAVDDSTGSTVKATTRFAVY